MRVVYFGTPNIAAKVLSFLLENDVEIVAVVTKPDRPKGRSGEAIPTPVKVVALAHNLPVYQPEIVSDPAFAPTLEHYDADLFVVVAYGEIIKQHLLDMPKKACVNLHASLLPKYRGAAPIQRCIIEGEKESGVTIMYMVRKMDAGDMIKVAKVPIGPNMTAGELEEALCETGKHALLDVIRAFEQGPVPGTPQDHTQATLAPKMELEDCQIDWSQSAEILHNLVRGATPHPGAWCTVKVKGQEKRLKLLQTVVEPRQGAPRSILSGPKEGLIIACGQDALRLSRIQLEGKKAMSDLEFACGISFEQLQF